MAALRAAAVTRFGEGRDPTDMVREVTDDVLADAGLAAGEIDALVVANAAAEAFTDVGNVSVWTATQAGLAGVPALRVDTGPSSGLAALWTARGLLEMGHDNVLALGWEAMTGVRTDEATRILAGLMAPDERDAGLSLPGLVALMASAYLDRHGVDPARMDHTALKAHRLAAANPIAQFQQPVALDDVASSRTIADPLKLYHCAPLTDGAAAAVVAREGPVEVAGMGHATDLLGLTQRRSPPEGFEATQRAAAQLWDRVDAAPADVDVAEVHDAFTVLEAIDLEDLGLAPRGQGFAHVPEPGGDPLTGDLAVNPGGGLKARGHPIGATGLAQTAACFDQLTGRAPTQVPDAATALAHNIGGFGNNVHVALFEEASA